MRKKMDFSNHNPINNLTDYYSKSKLSSPIRYLLTNNLFTENMSILSYGKKNDADIEILKNRDFNLDVYDYGELGNIPYLRYDVVYTIFQEKLDPIVRRFHIENIIDYLKEDGKAYILVYFLSELLLPYKQIKTTQKYYIYELDSNSIPY
jgi:hypothetical protein